VERTVPPTKPTDHMTKRNPKNTSKNCTQASVFRTPPEWLVQLSMTPRSRPNVGVTGTLPLAVFWVRTPLLGPFGSQTASPILTADGKNERLSLWSRTETSPEEQVFQYKTPPEWSVRLSVTLPSRLNAGRTRALPLAVFWVGSPLLGSFGPQTA